MLNRNNGLSRRRALLGGVASAAAGIALVKGSASAFGQVTASSSGGSLPVGAIQAIFGASGSLEDGGVLNFDFPRNDFIGAKTPSIFGIPVDPGWGFDTEITFQPAGKAALVKWEFSLLEEEVNAVLDTLLAAKLPTPETALNAIHNHFIEELPRTKFVHGTALGDPIAIANILKTALRRSAQPFSSPQTRKPTPVEQQITRIIGGQATASGKVLSIRVPRKDSFAELNVPLQPASQIEALFNFQEIGGVWIADCEIPVRSREADAVARSMKGHDFTIMALHNHELFIEPDLYYFHLFGKGNGVTLAQAIRQALALTNAKFSSS
ncbi:MAG: hypothetical protein JWO51_3647 [Rhodospirillales bacterium]|nr:hypothetical protein [Rhodospirillales bacterium]